MNEPILTLASLAEDARRAAERYLATSCEQPNPHMPGTDAAARWQVLYRRYVDSAVPEAEGGA